MALITCTECRKELSDQAATCPHCGAPTNVRPQTIEKTSKKYKGEQLIALLVVGVSLMGLVGTCDEGGHGQTVFMALLAVGLIWYVTVRALVWWHHG